MRSSRFSQEPTSLVQQYGESISYDWRLYRQDIVVSIAHTRGQLKANLLTQTEFDLIERGLREIEDEIKRGSFEFSTQLEDIHINIEVALTQRIGEVGAKLHTARSRNDQVATDTRLYVREEIIQIKDFIRQLQVALVKNASRYQKVILPGYTHLQRGQPVFWAHHLLAYVEMLGRDTSRLSDCAKRLNQCPLGSGALAGSTLCLDRESISQELGFDEPTQNSMDAISDRDYLLEILFSIALIGTHLSRLSEDIILWNSTEFNFIQLSDAHTTGSSLMPQKKNPDMAELTRGKTGRLYGNLISLLTVVKGLPLTYNRDLQEDKEALFDSIDTIKLALQVNAEMMTELTVNQEVCLEASSDPFLLATDLADYLVENGMAFRQAHDLVGRAVAESIAQQKSWEHWQLADWQKISNQFNEGVKEIFSLEKAMNARDNVGSPHPMRVEEQLKKWEKALLTD